jgi:uncharacterized SAM-binding protein YcdF (DUF218 family)
MLLFVAAITESGMYFGSHYTQLLSLTVLSGIPMMPSDSTQRGSANGIAPPAREGAGSTTHVSTAVAGACVDAVVCPGGGLTADGAVPPHVVARLMRAVSVFTISHEHCKPIIIVLSAGASQRTVYLCMLVLVRARDTYRHTLYIVGTTHKPSPMDSAEHAIKESTAAARFLLEVRLTPAWRSSIQMLVQRGVPAEYILEEGYSLDSIGNAYFLRTIHTDPAQLHSLTIVTNEFHMPRTKAIFEFVFSLPYHNCSPPKYSLRFEKVADLLPNDVKGETLAVMLVYHGELSEKEVNFLSWHCGEMCTLYKYANCSISQLTCRKEARYRREAKSLHDFHSFSQSDNRPADMLELHRWLFQQHNAYAAQRLKHESMKIESLDSKLLESY